MKINPINLIMVLASVILTALPAGQAKSGQAEINVIVKTILASHEQKFLDRRISPLIQELQSIFGYSSYRLLGDTELKLRIGEEGVVVLPENRVLKIVPIKIKHGRVELRLEILKGKNKTFKTVIQLKNNGIITVGGPKLRTGVMLINIYTAF